jgi:D-3-phosphoglycerate dehydrogenase / 2-oxoglutarate reductase
MMNSELRILLAEKSSFSEQGIAALSDLGLTDALDLTHNELLARIPEYDILVLRLGLRVDAEILKAAPNLKFIVTPTTGLDHIDLAVATQNEVEVLSLKGEREFLDRVPSTAEHTFALMMALLRKIPASFEAVKDYQWRRDVFRGYELDGKTIGLVGCGRLGTMMVRYCQAFGMQVLVYDPYQENLPAGIEQVDTLKELLSVSDIVSLHVHLNDETRGMISEVEFSLIKPGAVLINTARGAIVDDAALLSALENRRLAGAAVDVVSDEHQIEANKFHPLIDFSLSSENLIITPHIGGATFEAVEKADLFVIGKLMDQITHLS